MEHCYRIALWMFCLIGYLQAKPVCSEKDEGRKPLHFIKEDLDLDATQTKVICGQNLTFISPTNVEKLCYPAALESFMDELETAETKCTGEISAISQTLDALFNSYPERSKCPHPSQCKWDTRKEFLDFVETMKHFVDQVNNQLNDEGRQ